MGADHVGAHGFVFHPLVAELAEQGRAILLIFSDLPEMVTPADRIAVLNVFAVAGELVDKYEPMSQAVIRMIHT